jgi:hypothetical protein
MKENDTKTPFKFDIFGFKLDTFVSSGISVNQIILLIVVVFLFIIGLIFLIHGYAVLGLILNKASKLEIFKIIKSKFP